jgi:SAM-dependent methyltransferase
MAGGSQRAEQNWHDVLFASRQQRDLVVLPSIRKRYTFPSRNPRFQLEFMFKAIGDIRGKRVLVFGCGDDSTTVLLALKGAEVWAFDLSEQAIRLQQKMARANGVDDRIHLIVGAAEEFPFAANSFDLIVGAAILHHIPDHLADLPPQLARSLRPNGRALFVEPVVLSRVLGRMLAWLPGHQDISPGERQLTPADLNHFSKTFRVTPHVFCFLARADRFVLNGPLETASMWRWSLIHAFHWGDRVLLSIPFMKRLAGVAVLELSPLRQ